MQFTESLVKHGLLGIIELDEALDDLSSSGGSSFDSLSGESVVDGILLGNDGCLVLSNSVGLESIFSSEGFLCLGNSLGNIKTD